MRILLSGSSGLLGGALIKKTIEQNDSVDKLDRESVWQLTIDEISYQVKDYDLLIHAAANTNVEACESDPNSCYQDNFYLTEKLARASLLGGVRLVFISSTGIYGNAKQTPYTEYDEVSPTTHHHKSKYKAECIVSQLHPSNLIIRTGWLFGGEYNTPKNWVARRIDEANSALKNNCTLKSNSEQRGVPCFNLDIAQRILLLAKNNYAGIFNCVNSGNASRLEYVEAIIEAAKIDIQVEAIQATHFNRKAQVSPNEMADNWKMNCSNLPVMPPWKISLEQYIKTLTIN